MPSWSARAGGGLSGRETVSRLARRALSSAQFRVSGLAKLSAYILGSSFHVQIFTLTKN